MGSERVPVAMPAAGAVVSLVGALASIYLVSQFLRMSVGVIAPDLAVEFDLSASQVGLLASIFFFAFALAQIPLGICIDRYGPKRCMVACAAVVVAGIVLFAVSTTTAGLLGARALMGLGTSGYLMAPLAIYAQRFPPERFGFFAGLQLSIGTCGTLIATAPFAYVVAEIGWRATFLLVAIVMAGAGFLVAIVVKETSASPSGPRHETFAESLKGVGEALRIQSVMPVFVMQLANYSSFAFFVGLWGGPYLTHVYGFGLKERGMLLLIPVVAQIAGSITWGTAQRWFAGHKAPIYLGAWTTAGLLAALAIAGRPPLELLIVWFVLFGFAAAYTPLLISHGKSLFPPRLIGRGMTLLNIGSIGGVFVSQTLTGEVMGTFATVGNVYPVVGYQAVFATQAAFGAVACLIYLRARDIPSRSASQNQ